MTANTGAAGINISLLESREEIAAYSGTPLEQRYAPRTTLEALRDGASRFGERVALSFQLTPDPDAPLHETSFAGLLEQAIKFANAAYAAGARPGARVAILLPNAPEMVFAMFGGHFLGACAPINPMLEPNIIASILRDMDAEILVTLAPTPGSDIAEKAAAAAAEAPTLKTVVEVNLLAYLGAPGNAEPGRKLGDADLVEYRAFTAAAPGDRLLFERSVGPEDLCALFHSGGTTGAPKLVTHRHRQVVANAAVSNAMLQLGQPGDPQPVILSALPMFHVFGAYVLLFSPLAIGAKIVICTPAGYRTPGLVENYWKIVARHGAHMIAAVPTAVSALDQIPVDADVSTVKLMVSGGSALPAPLAQRFAQKTGLRICEGYGMTETVACLCFNPHVGGPKTGAVGLVAPYLTVRIAEFDAEGRWRRDCDIDESGEVCVQGPNVFSGYLDPSRDDAVFFEAPEGAPGRFFRTGDLGRIDGQGYVWLTGRAKDVIIRGGHNIDPGMIEDALVAHPAVAFVGAIGQPDAQKGEMPCAYVELVDGAAATEAELMAFASERVAERAARPVSITILKELPKTAVGKVFKPALRRAAAQRVAEAALAASGLGDVRVEIEDDRKLGQVMVIRGAASGDEATVGAALDGVAPHWRLAP